MYVVSYASSVILSLIVGVMTTCYNHNLLFKLQGSIFIIMHILGEELHLFGWTMWRVLEQSQEYWTAAMTV